MDDRTMLAGMAMQGLLANGGVEWSSSHRLASHALEHADAILTCIDSTTPRPRKDGDSVPGDREAMNRFNTALQTSTSGGHDDGAVLGRCCGCWPAHYIQPGHSFSERGRCDVCHDRCRHKPPPRILGARMTGLLRERPIILSALEVRGILDGIKSQIRRPISGLRRPMPGSILPRLPTAARHRFGKPGDRLWVNETWCWKIDPFTDRPLDECWYAADPGPHIVKSDGDGGTAYNEDGSEASPWISPSRMPRECSRILLEVINIHFERLNSINEEDAKAEGARFHDGRGIGHSGWRHDYGAVHADARSSPGCLCAAQVGRAGMESRVRLADDRRVKMKPDPETPRRAQRLSEPSAREVTRPIGITCRES